MWITRRRRARAASDPATGDLVLLVHPGLVLEPDFYLSIWCKLCANLYQPDSKAPLIRRLALPRPERDGVAVPTASHSELLQLAAHVHLVETNSRSKK